MENLAAAIDELAFNKNHLALLMSIQYHSLLKEANLSVSFSKVRKFLMSQEDKSLKISRYREKKRCWIKSWLEITKKLLDVELLSKETIKSEVTKINKKRKVAFVVEIATFEPYFKLSETEDSIDVRYDNSDKDYYIKESARLLNLEDTQFHQSSKYFNDCAKKIAKTLSGFNWTIPLVGIGAAILLFTAPFLAGSIGGLMGLTGAAATSAGLAFLGGGSLAAGGLGMTGGYIALMAGGAILGYGTGTKEYKKRLASTSKEELLICCSKLFSYLKISNANNLEKSNTCEKAREMQFDFEQNSDIKYIEGVNAEGESNAIKAATLGAFRKILREGEK